MCLLTATRGHSKSLFVLFWTSFPITLCSVIEILLFPAVSDFNLVSSSIHTVFYVSFVAAVFSWVTLYLLLCVCGFSVLWITFCPCFFACCSVFGSIVIWSFCNRESRDRILQPHYRFSSMRDRGLFPVNTQDKQVLLQSLAALRQQGMEVRVFT